MTRDEAWKRWERRKRRFETEHRRSATYVTIGFVVAGLVVMSLIIHGFSYLRT